MLIDKNLQLSENDLKEGTWYCCFHIGFDGDMNTRHEDGSFFKYLGNDTAELDSNACGESNELGDVPYADFYIPA